MFTVRRALISVSDKRGLIPFARGLQELGIEILSTGGTCRQLVDAGFAYERTDLGDTVIISLGPDRNPIAFGILTHAAKLEYRKRLTAPANSFLPVEYRSGTFQFHRQCGKQGGLRALHGLPLVTEFHFRPAMSQRGEDAQEPDAHSRLR